MSLEDREDPLTAKRARILRKLCTLSARDLTVIEAIVDELPIDDLVARCEAETDLGVEGHGERVELPPTSLLSEARGWLLKALDKWRLVVGGRAWKRVPRGVDETLRRYNETRLAHAIAAHTSGKEP